MTYDQAEQIVATIDALVAHRLAAERHRQRGEPNGFLDDSASAELARKQLVELLAAPIDPDPTER